MCGEKYKAIYSKSKHVTRPTLSYKHQSGIVAVFVDL